MDKVKFIRADYLTELLDGKNPRARVWKYKYKENMSAKPYIEVFNISYSREEIIRYLREKGINTKEIRLWPAIVSEVEYFTAHPEFL